MPELLLILIRSVLSFAVLLLLTRLMGKKQISQLTFFDYVVGITIGSIAASMSVDQNVMFANGLVGLAVWGLIPILISLLSLKSNFFRALTSGSPSTLIENGKILEENLAKEYMTSEQLIQLLRQKNAFHLADVEFAVLETDGQLSVMKKSDAEPISPRTLGLSVEQAKDPRLVIMDGNVLEQTLRQLGYSKQWLLKEIKKQGANDFSDVFIAQLASDGTLYVDLSSDAAKIDSSTQNQLLKTRLQKTLSDLETRARQAKDEREKQMWEQEAKRMKGILTNIDALLK